MGKSKKQNHQLQAKPDEFKGVLSKEDIIPLDQDEAILKSFRDSAIYVAEKDNRIVDSPGTKINSFPSCWRSRAYLADRSKI